MTALDDIIKFLEGPRATLERMILTMEFILDHFEQGKVCSNWSIATYNHTLLLNRALALFLFLWRESTNLVRIVFYLIGHVIFHIYFQNTFPLFFYITIKLISYSL